eukprot:TRINITY_DN6635_c0_g2_i1.p1 TRINITY_DN6635_c0_g2~~TRINITY_DN6635_c0_g2_i1.p1  ORF type:complete len:756 (-),score=155.82 TRINITY_DN6635_c0_g2_i1:596-2863(-)
MAAQLSNRQGGGGGVRRGLQPDSLKLICQLAVLKHIHRVAFQLEVTQGDKSFGKHWYLRGVQGRVCNPVWNRDYFYFTGLINEIRIYLRENCVNTLVNDLFKLALSIFNSNDNRRRMGAELILLCMLSNESQVAWSLPTKYHDTETILDMLVSCKQRFQKPKVVPFWSKQSEALLLSTLRHASSLTKLVLPLCNDLLLKSIAVYCRKLVELEIGFAEDVSEEGLLAISGRSAYPRDQGLHRKYENALYLQNDFGPAQQWYVKDSMLFTPPTSTKRSLPPKECDKLLQTYPTHFGCTRLKRLKIFGNFIFPPRANRSKFNKNLKGPILETGFYCLLLHLKNLEDFVIPAASLMVARLSVLLTPDQLVDTKLLLKELSFGWDERLEAQEMTSLAKICPRVKTLRGVSNGIPNDFHISAFSDRFRIDDAVCDFVKRFHNLSTLSGNMKLTCLNSYLRLRGDKLTHLSCSSLLLSTADLVTLRRFCVNLTRLDARLTLDNTVDKGFVEYHCDHSPEFRGTLVSQDINIDSPWPEWRSEIARWPWKRLKHLDLNGRFNLIILQLLLGSADHLEILSVTNWPNEMVSGGMALDDSWIPGILAANPLHNIKEFCLKMEIDHFVEEGFLTKTSLNSLIHHAMENCPKLERIVGEWTKIPDRELAEIQQRCWKQGLKVAISNAEPYRDFQNYEDNDRYYGMNAGYWRLRGIPARGDDLAALAAAAAAGGAVGGLAVAAAAEGHEEEAAPVHVRYPRTFGYVYRP